MLKVAIIATVIALALTAGVNEWKSRSIYQVLTDRFYRTDGSTTAPCDLRKYCGGTYKGLQSQLDYIKGMGFDAIWISPIPKNKGEDYHGYGALDFYESNEHFGTKEELKEFVDAAHAKGIWVMVDMVANHVAAVDLDFDQIIPFNKPEHYHTKCNIDYNDQHSIEYCRITPISPDLDTESDYVKKTLFEWYTGAVKEYGFDGIRVDTVKHVPKPFWQEWSAQMDIYQTGEILDGDIGYVADYQRHGLNSVLDYPIYFTFRDAYKGKQSMYSIRHIITESKNQYPDMGALGVFFDNHDQPRFLSFDEPTNAQLKAGLTFTFFTHGVPIMYYGTETKFNGGNDPDNREPMWKTGMPTDTELYKYIALLNKIRSDNKIWNHDHIERWVDDDVYAWSRGDLTIATTNRGHQIDR